MGGAAAGREPNSAERILEVATALFAERGFAGVSTRDIAAAAGLNIATVHHHAGRKADLYEAVFARLHAAEREVLERVAAGLDDDTLADPQLLRTAVHAALDNYLAFLAEHPAVVQLWMRRWLDGPHEIDSFWTRYGEPLYRLIEERLEKAAAHGVIQPMEPHLVLRTIVWATHGYLAGGLPRTGHAGVEDPHDPQALERFGAFLRQLADQMLWSAPQPPEPPG